MMIKEMEEAFRAFAEIIEQLRLDFYECIKSFEEIETDIALPNRHWIVPTKILSHHQVTNRKPIMIRARSTC
ncbi:hypothetical protein BTS2_0548 [Bacillus sp. TS-2]|nr:hypothetical protein BTS2_0548 [Bacillus sp. TS-2]